MSYRSLADCVLDLEKKRSLVRLDFEVDPHLELAEIQRRAYRRGSPALLFERVQRTKFPVLCNLFGTLERTRGLFGAAIEDVQKLLEVKGDPEVLRKAPLRYWNLPLLAWRLAPGVRSRGPILAHRTTIDQLPHLTCWPEDGGAFITLPQVYSEDPDRPGTAGSNLGMYRVQLSGNQYAINKEVGLHYQIHRGIGVHHQQAIRRGESLRVNVFVGGPPAFTLAAVMPLPEGVSELAFAGVLGRRAVRVVRAKESPLPIPVDADFCIVGRIAINKLLPEGPFGDHLGYYSLTHDFPVLEVDAVYHRSNAIWPFTSVGRPPQEDTSFGAFIHEMTASMIPRVLPGVHAVHAVDAAGVHPLLLALGSERYMPYASASDTGAGRRPMELLVQANAILGQGQLSLAKYLWIAAREDEPALDIHDIPKFFRHMLERVDWTRDLHFQTETTMDTLDYSGGALNSGSKVVVAAVGPAKRHLANEWPTEPGISVDGFGRPRRCLSGVFAFSAPECRTTPSNRDPVVERFLASWEPFRRELETVPLIVLVDDAELASKTVDDFLWTVFTRSDPAADVHGIQSFTDRKHWGCRGPLVIDARLKSHHAPPLVQRPEVVERVDRLAAPGGPLHGLV